MRRKSGCHPGFWAHSCTGDVLLGKSDEACVFAEQALCFCFRVRVATMLMLSR